MISVYQIKPAFQNLLRPACGGLVALGVTANAVTVFALLVSLAVGACIAVWPAEHWPLLLLPVALFLRMALNAIDGMIAREFDMQSRLGALLNEMGDVLSDAALYLPLGLLAGVSARWMTIIVVLAMATELIGVLATSIGAERRYDGPMGKSDRALVLGAFALVLGLGVTRGAWITWFLVAIVAALVLTILQRGRRALVNGGKR